MPHTKKYKQNTISVADCNRTDEEINLMNIESVGIGGEHLIVERTFICCRAEFFSLDLMFSQSYEE